MRLPFTKMQGAGNDFVVLDATRAPIELTLEQVQRLGDRRFGVGADQILVVENSSTPGRGLPPQHLQRRQRRRGRALRQRRPLLRALRARAWLDRQDWAVSQSVSQPAQPSQPRAMADAAIFQRAVLACMDRRGYTLR